ncbi:MAG: RNA polymerase sigma factor [Bacteroidota bacterium]
MKSKDEACQKLLVSQYAPFLFSVCRRYTRDDHEARDVLQDSFIRIFDSIQTLKGGSSSLKPWMKRITINMALSKKKLISYSKVDYPDSHFPLVVTNPTVHTQLNVEDILDLLKQLSEEQQRVFNMAIIDGYSHKEIAEVLGIAVGTSRSFLSRARQTMQTLILKQEGHEVNSI